MARRTILTFEHASKQGEFAGFTNTAAYLASEIVEGTFRTLLGYHILVRTHVSSGTRIAPRCSCFSCVCAICARCTRIRSSWTIRAGWTNFDIHFFLILEDSRAQEYTRYSLATAKARWTLFELEADDVESQAQDEQSEKDSFFHCVSCIDCWRYQLLCNMPYLERQNYA
jgi:hypothetical protein